MSIASEVINAIEKILDNDSISDTPESVDEAIKGICVAFCSLMVSAGVEKESAQSFFNAVYDVIEDEYRNKVV